MPRAIKGVLVECDPSIKAIILKIDEDSHHAFIIESANETNPCSGGQDLDENTLMVKEAKLAELKDKLEKILEKTQMQEKEEESDPEQPG
ncbi:hypothetical protein RUND412_001483 [Rhizina undulata]